MKFLQDCEKMYAIRSMDMESLAFAALTHFAGVKGQLRLDLERFPAGFSPTVFKSIYGY